MNAANFTVRKRVIALAILLSAVVMAGPTLAADDFCEQLKSFEQKPLNTLPDDELQGRWFDFSWAAPEKPKGNEVQIGSTLRCRGSDDVAHAMCQYLLRNTPYEGMTGMPLSILRCHNLVSDEVYWPEKWVQEIGWDTPNSLIEVFQIDQFIRPGHVPSMRLAIRPYPESSLAKKPEPFFKALAAKLGADNSHLR